LVDKSLVVSGVTAGGCAYSAPWRVIAGVLTVLVAAALLLILFLVLVSTDPPVTPEILCQLIAVLVLPAAAALWWIRGVSAARIEVDHLTLSIDRRGLRLEVPCNAIEAVVPWVLPLPGPGFSLRMRSGRRLRYGLETVDAATVLRALAEVAEAGAAAGAAHHPTVRYAAAKSATARRSRTYLLFKFGVFALLPAIILFNAHQHIAYGGSLGQYYMLGLRSYVTTFCIYFATTVIYLILYASLWRVLTEALSLSVAWLAPAATEATRRVAETFCQAVYYGGVPLLLLARFMA
jgi:apolipoprotein N-acyltransferase